MRCPGSYATSGSCQRQLLYRSASDSSHEMLFGGRSLVDHELDAIELAFSRAGLDAWQRSGRQIQIPKEKRSEYLAALSDTSAAPPFTLRNPMKEAMRLLIFLIRHQCEILGRCWPRNKIWE